MPLAVVARFSTNGEAGIAMSALDAAGIEADLADDVIIAMDWLYSNAVGGVKLVVRDDDLEAAADVLLLTAEEPVTANVGASEEATADAATAEPDAVPAPIRAPEAARCPACGSEGAARTPRLMLFVFISVVLGGVGLAVGQSELAVAAVFATALITAMVPSHRCMKCGERWNPGESEQSNGAETAKAPLPDPRDTIEERCPRCGSANFHHIAHRRLKAITLLFEVTIVVVLLVWPFLPKKHCDDCGSSI